MEDKRISKAVIQRLPRYYRYLGNLIDEGVERISSKALSERMHITASQIRQDFNNFGGFGQQGYGYNVHYLHDEIGRILNLDAKHNLIIIGIGNMGHALAGLLKNGANGFHVCGLFDTDPWKIGNTVIGLEIQSMNKLEDFLKDNKIDIAILAVPTDYALSSAETLVKLGIKSIWNFALTDLDLYVPEGVVVENVHLMESLMRLSYNSNAQDGYTICD